MLVWLQLIDGTTSVLGKKAVVATSVGIQNKVPCLKRKKARTPRNTFFRGTFQLEQTFKTCAQAFDDFLDGLATRCFGVGVSATICTEAEGLETRVAEIHSDFCCLHVQVHTITTETNVTKQRVVLHIHFAYRSGMRIIT